jgi:hypothetical protein
MGPDPSVEISARQVPQEPMVGFFLSFSLLVYLIHLKKRCLSPPPLKKYIIINLGMSKNFGVIDFDHLTFPNHMRVDYIRVYQDIRQINIGCDPEGYPTLKYINKSVKTTILLCK